LKEGACSKKRQKSWVVHLTK